jgi:hypothetical protein
MGKNTRERKEGDKRKNGTRDNFSLMEREEWS